MAMRYSHERSDARPSKPVDAAPGPHHRLLHGVLGLEARAEHPVAVAGQLPPVRLELLLDRARLGAILTCDDVGTRGTSSHGRHRRAVRRQRYASRWSLIIDRPTAANFLGRRSVILGHDQAELAGARLSDSNRQGGADLVGLLHQFGPPRPCLAGTHHHDVRPASEVEPPWPVREHAQGAFDVVDAGRDVASPPAVAPLEAEHGERLHPPPETRTASRLA